MSSVISAGRGGTVTPIERLTAADLSMVWPEDFGWPQDIGAIAVLDGPSLLDATGRFRIEEVRNLVGSRLHLLPRFRQRLYLPRLGLGGRCGWT